ncbi:hypothetical protein [Arthrobacter sp. fls2-241-R2A-172]|uniref:hypothetical protein n=1 Tax=Arthrobacter sp. fls2-241-R2A-172 TaxID=3040325 RepID=UPI00254E4A04|nr:hypothetical protein [Arthrobacter sp. fls2-241-R2A-172]
MTGAPARPFLWLVVVATILTGCTPSSGAGEIVSARPQASITATQPQGGPAPSSPLPGDSQTTTQPQAAPAPSSPLPTTIPAPPAVPQPFALNLYQEGDFVPQYTFEWCVAASIQMAHNLVDATGGGAWTASAQQGELWEMARARSSDSFNGANPYGWAQVLTEVGMGPYKVVSVALYDDALRTAAKAITETGRPVGLVMWSGRHAWVMSGFESMGDPRVFADFSVTGVRVLDPLYPYGSGQWGPSPEPNSLVSPAQLATQFVVREPRRWSSQLPTGYLLVLPVGAVSG